MERTKFRWLLCYFLPNIYRRNSINSLQAIVTQTEDTLPNPFFEDSITLTPKPDKYTARD